MSDVFENMDNSFRKMAGEVKATYNPVFWMEMESQLSDAGLDEAFREAAGNVVAPAALPVDFSEVNDTFLDESFRQAASTYQLNYSAAHWNDYLANESDIVQNEVFITAASSVTAAYQPAFWTEADVALQAEGLHYEYKSAYWDEAKSMLDLAERRQFFYRWSGVASLLMLISLLGGGLYTTQMSNGLVKDNTAQLLSLNLTSQPNTIVNNNESENNNGQNVAVINNASESALAEANVNGNVSSGQVDLASNNNESTTTEIVGNTTNNGENISGLELNQNATAIETTYNSGINYTSGTGHFMTRNDEFWTITKKIENEKHFVLENENLAVQHGISTIKNMPELSGVPTIGIVGVPQFKHKPSHQISIYAGIGLGREFGDYYLDAGRRTKFGIEYRRATYGKLHRFEFGATAGVSHMRQSSLGTEQRTTQYFMNGSVSKSWYKLRLTNMYYASAGIFTTIKLNSRNKISIGAAYDRLINVKSNMSYQIGSDAEIVTVNNNWGIVDGINKQDIRLTAGYELALNKRLSVQLNAGFGLMDRTDDVFLNNVFTDHEVEATIGIRYNLFRIR